MRRKGSIPGTGGETSHTSSLRPGTEPVLVPTGGMVRSRLTSITLLWPSVSVSASSSAPWLYTATVMFRLLQTLLHQLECPQISKPQHPQMGQERQLLKVMFG